MMAGAEEALKGRGNSVRLSLSHSLGNVKPPHPSPAEAGQVPAHTVQAGRFSDSHLLLIHGSEGNLLCDFAHLVTFHNRVSGHES